MIAKYVFKQMSALYAVMDWLWTIKLKHAKIELNVIANGKYGNI